MQRTTTITLFCQCSWEKHVPANEIVQSAHQWLCIIHIVLKYTNYIVWYVNYLDVQGFAQCLRQQQNALSVPYMPYMEPFAPLGFHISNVQAAALLVDVRCKVSAKPCTVTTILCYIERVYVHNHCTLCVWIFPTVYPWQWHVRHQAQHSGHGVPVRQDRGSVQEQYPRCSRVSCWRNYMKLLYCLSFRFLIAIYVLYTLVYYTYATVQEHLEICSCFAYCYCEYSYLHPGG